MGRFFELARLADAAGAAQLLSVFEQFFVALFAFNLQAKALIGIHWSIVRWDCLGQVSVAKTVTYEVFLDAQDARAADVADPVAQARMPVRRATSAGVVRGSP